MELKQIYHNVDKAWDAAVKTIKAAGGRINCGPHCSACCRDTRYFVPLPVSEPEAALMIEALGALDEEGRQLVLNQHLTDHGHYCVFRSIEGCLIYPARPLRCRIYGLPGSPWECKLNKVPDNWTGDGAWVRAVDDALDGLAYLDNGKRVSFYDIIEKWRRK